MIWHYEYDYTGKGKGATLKRGVGKFCDVPHIAGQNEFDGSGVSVDLTPQGVENAETAYALLNPAPLPGGFIADMAEVRRGWRTCRENGWIVEDPTA